MSTSNKMKIKDDPRVLASLQKNSQYLVRLLEEQSKQNHMMKLMMQETAKFQNDMYTSLRMLDGRLNVTCENVEGLQETTDHINSRVRSIHKHIKEMQGGQFTDLEQSKMLNSTRQQTGMSTFSKLPRTTQGFKAAISSKFSQRKQARTDIDSISDSDESMATTGMRRGLELSPDINLLQPSNSLLGSSAKTLQPNISISDIQTGRQNRSPVPITNNPPVDTHRPDTRKASLQIPGRLDVSAIKPAQRITRRLLSNIPSEADVRSLLLKFNIDLSALGVSAISKACQQTNAPSSRAVGLHTVMIIDTSSSIKSHISDIKVFINQMLDCVDNSAGEYGLEEHIAMVMCGSTVEILQPFTNDFMQVRSKLDSINGSGRSALHVALALALIYLMLYGETIEIHGHRIPPRIVVLSDFHVTSDEAFEGADQDTRESITTTQQQVLKLAEVFQSTQYPVFCVPVGQWNQSVCKELARKSDGSVIPIIAPDTAGNFYKYRAVVGCVTHSYDLSMKDGEELDTTALVQQFLPQVGLTQSDQTIVEEMLYKSLELINDDMDELSIENDGDTFRVPNSAIGNQPRIESPEENDMHPDADHVTASSVLTSDSHMASGTQSSRGPVYQVSQTSQTSGDSAYHGIDHQQSSERHVLNIATSQDTGYSSRVRDSSSSGGKATGTRSGSERTSSRLRLDDENQRNPKVKARESVPLLPEWKVIPATNSLSFEERADLPLIGTRVVRDKDWSWENQDGNGPGTVIGHKEKGLIYIVWDISGIAGTFRYRYEGKIDVKVQNEPRAVGDYEIEIGCWVTRGPDWNRGDEDGGQGTVGVVIRKLPDRVVMVRWPSRVIESYKFGADNKWELQVTMTKPLSDFQEVPDQMAHAEAASATRNEVYVAAWFWMDQSGQWRIFQPENLQKIESKYETNPSGNLMVHQHNYGVKVYLDKMQCEIHDQHHRLKRELIPKSEMESLNEVEKFMS